MLGCGAGQLFAPTITPSATITPTLTLAPTSTPRPTSTPNPTATKVPPTPTPASLGEAVSYKSIEVSVLDVYRHDNLIPGNGYRYWANPGYLIIDLVVKAHNTGTSPAAIKWSDTYVIDSDGMRSDVLFGGSRTAASKQKVDPLSIDYNAIYGDTAVEFEDTAYMRIIYIITEKPEQKVLFGVGDSPLIEFNVKR
jgi:hypothetical protein